MIVTWAGAKPFGANLTAVAVIQRLSAASLAPTALEVVERWSQQQWSGRAVDFGTSATLSMATELGRRYPRAAARIFLRSIEHGTTSVAFAQVSFVHVIGMLDTDAEFKLSAALGRLVDQPEHVRSAASLVLACLVEPDRRSPPPAIVAATWSGYARRVLPRLRPRKVRDGYPTGSCADA